MGFFGKKDKEKTKGKLPSDFESNMVKIPDDLLEEDSDESKEKRVKKEKSSPMPVYIIMFSSILFSFFFLTYRKIDSFIKSGQALSPNVNLSFSLDTVKFYIKKASGGIPTNLAPQDIEKNLTEVLKDNLRNWGVHVEVYPSSQTGSSRFWSLNSQVLGTLNPADLYYQLKNQKPEPNSFLKPELPQGVLIKQKYSESNQEIRLDALISVPTKDMLISLKAISQVDLQKAKKTLPELVSIIYWSFSGVE